VSVSCRHMNVTHTETSKNYKIYCMHTPGTNVYNFTIHRAFNMFECKQFGFQLGQGCRKCDYAHWRDKH